MITIFQITLLIVLLFWIFGSILFFFESKRAWSIALILLGQFILTALIVIYWIKIERPPLRTMGETRLWYTWFLASIALWLYYRKTFRYILPMGLALALVFLVVNLLNPELLNKALMPALQSVWFIPHVIVYLVAYALLSLVWLMAVFQLFKTRSNQNQLDTELNRILKIGFAFLSLGLVFGALWAKTAWGHYWTWDPKETWALITWAAYLIIIHYQDRYQTRTQTILWLIVVSFVLLLICWFGVQYLPSAQMSVHTYSG
jgi:ABC-type transport system involved in cytochrome c biogenesis permease subunit